MSEKKYTAAVITVSDRGYRGEREDTSGPALCRMLAEKGWQVVYTVIVPDDFERIRAELLRCAEEIKASLVLTTGGTGFSPRDITPEAALSVAERLAPGIPEAMRAESMRITPRGCLSRETAVIRGQTLIVNLPGSPKAALENISAVMDSLKHGVDMLMSGGSADCAVPADKAGSTKPSADAWLSEAKRQPDADQVGMYLIHNGIVRATARKKVRDHDDSTKAVVGMHFSYDAEKAEQLITEARQMEGVYCVKVWLNEGLLQVGDDIMMVLIGADIRPHAVAALETLVGRLKKECVSEKEIFAEE